MMTNSKVNEMTEELSKDFVRFKLGRNIEVPCSVTAKTLRRLAADVEHNHEELFKNMLKAVHSGRMDETVFLRIVKEMFADEIVNWGRIAVMYTFAGQMAVFCERNHIMEEPEDVAQWLSMFVKKNLINWITRNGGWDAFNEYFKEKHENSDMWWGNVLCTVGLVAGAAGAALVFAR